MHPEKTKASLLAIASSDLKNGRIVAALPIFEGLSKSDDFLMKGDAIVGLANALGWLPSPDSLNTKRQTLEGLLADEKTCKPGTVFQANVQTHLAETYTALRQYGKAYEMLGKATAIYFDQGVHKRREVAIYLQGTLEVVNGRFEEALQKINDAATFGMIDIPSFPPASWFFSSDAPTEQIEHNSVVALASS